MASIAPCAHTRRDSSTDSWITPKYLIDRLGPFDLDPCAATPQPWKTATRMISKKEDGLLSLWDGLVWLNPPYGKSLGTWLNRLALHGHGIALVFARTDTQAFHRHVWPFASMLLFIEGRLTFCTPTGKLAPLGHNSGGPSVLIAYGETAADRLIANRSLGALCRPIRDDLAF